jgi:hypothetical protein
LNEGQPAWALRAITGKSANAWVVNPTNMAAAWNAGQYIVLGSSSAPADQYIVGDATGTHAYAVANYTASSKTPFQMFNPWGADASGWAPGLFHGHKVYGLFSGNSTFLSQNFAGQTFGSGAAAEIDTWTHRGARTAADLVLAGWALSQC